MASPSDVSEPRPTRHRRTVFGFELDEAILLVLAVLVFAAAVALLALSQEAAAATMLVGVLVAVGSFRTIQITRQGQITERFTRAIDQLGDEKLDVRLGGIYALERIAWDSRDDRVQISEVLTAYVREHSPWPRKMGDRAQISEVLTAYLREHAPWPQKASDENDTRQADPARARPAEHRKPATDVQAVIAVLGRRNTSRDWEPILDLSSTDLEGALFAKGTLGDFHNANFQGACLRGARLVGTLLMGANFTNADLEGADLRRAHLEGADLRGAHLEGADLRDANPEEAEADLREVHVDRMDLRKAHLEGADLRKAHLEGADLREAHLNGAKLEGADLREHADLRGAKDLDGEQRKVTISDRTTLWV